MLFKMNKLVEHSVTMIIILLCIKGLIAMVNRFGGMNLVITWLVVSFGGAGLLYAIITYNISRRKKTGT